MNHPPNPPNTNTPTAPKPLNLVPLESPHWLDAYVAFAEAKSPMTPRDFHEAIGLWLISTVIARRLVAHMPHDDIYPNLWVMLVARSTLYAKTTAFNLARHFARRAIPHLLLPDASTPEAMLEILSGKELDGPAQAQAGQKGQIVDEASGMLAQSGRDYMAGALELYLRLYDCPPEFERVTRGPGRGTVHG
ncbi:MAG: YfjI family protein, partial [Chloroflexi bacterium]|nr:YfjI family protein [Chloroflexota bacterium]